MAVKKKRAAAKKAAKKTTKKKVVKTAKKKVAKKAAKKTARGRKPGSTPKGISRIDQPEKKNHGWFVRLQRNGKRFNSFFADSKYGGKKKAFAEARKAYDSMVDEHPAMSRKERTLKRMKSGSTGKTVVGVSRTTTEVNGREYAFWQAAWSPKVGRRCCVKFSVSRYGEQKAKDLAIKARKKGVSQIED